MIETHGYSFNLIFVTRSATWHNKKTECQMYYVAEHESY